MQLFLLSLPKPFCLKLVSHYIMKRREITLDNFNIFSTFIGYIFYNWKEKCSKITLFL